MKTLRAILAGQALVIGLALSIPALASQDLERELSGIQARWAEITYQMTGDDQREEAYAALDQRASELVAAWPDRAEPRVWQGIVLSTYAGVKGGMGALKLVKRAKVLFEQSLDIDEAALSGSAHTSLGSLYYQVPGWPLGFGDDDKAEAHLKAALALNPDGIDSNYFYGDYLVDQGRYQEAARYLEHALEAPDRAGRSVADAGRRQETRALMALVRQQLGS